LNATEERKGPRTAVSIEVRDFYERLPYPPPLPNLDLERS